MLFEIVATLGCLGIVVLVTIGAIRLMEVLEKAWGFIPAAWYVSAFLAIVSLYTSLGFVMLLRLL